MLSLTVLPEICFKIKITLHCSESPSGQEEAESSAGDHCEAER